MRGMKWLTVLALVAAVMLPWGVLAREGARPWQISNRLRVEYDDNIYQRENDKTGSFRIIEEVEFMFNFNLEQTFVSLRYRPSLSWYENRKPDKTDINHDLDFVFNHAFTPRLSLSLTDTLRRGEQPELQDGNLLVREDDDFYYNSFNATLGYRFRPETRLELAGRYVLLRYDSDTTSKDEDYDIYVGGLTLRHRLMKQTTMLGDFRVEGVHYDGVDRGSKSIYVGAGAEQSFSPSLVGNARAGYQRKNYNEDGLGDQNAPYGDLSLTFLPSPATRITGGASYSLWEANVFPYANQKRAMGYLSLANDFTAKISFYLSGSVARGKYDADQAVHQNNVVDYGGDENSYQASTRATYQLNRQNWLEASWQFIRLSSDLRESYTENRVGMGWKVRL